MPYLPPTADLFSVPNWTAIHPDLHKRWISTKPDKMRGHMWDFGGGGYVLYGSKYDTLDKLKAAALALGLSEHHVDVASGQIKIGDLVLACISREEYERRVTERTAAAADRDQQAIDGFLAMERRGIKPRVYGSEEEYKDERNFAVRESNNRVGATPRPRARA
jgi:hypothetical protein